MGMGFRRSLRDISMTAEVGWRSYGSDYLDDTSGDYVDASNLAEERSSMAAYFANQVMCLIQADLQEVMPIQRIGLFLQQ